jgi:hypothetical protein
MIQAREGSATVLSVNLEIEQRGAFVIVHRSFVISRKSPNVHFSHNAIFYFSP